MDGSRLVGWLPLIPLLPFVGFLLNGLFGRTGGRRFVTVVGVGAPLAAFCLALGAFCGMVWSNRTTAVATTQAARGRVLEQLAKANLEVYAPTPEDLAQGLIRVAEPEEGVSRALGGSMPDARIGLLGELAPRTYFGPGGATAGSDATWIAVDGFKVVFRFVFDQLSGLLVLVILGVGSLIHIYSLAYMETETPGGFARYFAYLNLFTAMMLVLVLAGDVLLMFVGWEGVGLSSYLLIGFEYKEGWKADAGIKAFVVNRVGDFGFILGVLALATASIVAGKGQGDLRLDHLNALVLAGGVPQLTLACAALCLFIGATGKSAQLPLYVWLPDAMAGPTPVSALIHAATMVTAGVYMVARLHPVFEHAVFPEGIALLGGVPVLGIIAFVGAATALFAATAACAQDDVKKVLAYSTVSQLGYMFLGAGVGAFGASIFHLVTHAFFKALLFLGAGALIHATGTQDLKRMGGLRHVLPVTFWTMLIGAAALAGLPVPFVGGYFSKDMILGKALEVALDPHHPWMLVVYGMGAIGGLITAFYSMRLIAFAFLGKPGRTAEHAHEAPPLMAQPLMILAVLTLLSGLLGLPAFAGFGGGSDLLEHFLEPAIGSGPVVHAVEHGAGAEITAVIISTILALAGAGLGYVAYARGPMTSWLDDAEAGRGSLAQPRRFLANAWGIDALYRSAIVEPIFETARALWELVDDALLDRGIVDGAARLARGFAELMAELENGWVLRYAAYVAVGVIAILAASVF